MVGCDLPEYSLAIWHGVNMPLVMSLVALAGGIVLYALLRWQRAKGTLDAPPLMHRIDGERLFAGRPPKLGHGAVVLLASEHLGNPLVQPERAVAAG